MFDSYFKKYLLFYISEQSSARRVSTTGSVHSYYSDGVARTKETSKFY